MASTGATDVLTPGRTLPQEQRFDPLERWIDELEGIEKDCILLYAQDMKFRVSATARAMRSVMHLDSEVQP
jgi:hypothetical protein